MADPRQLGSFTASPEGVTRNTDPFRGVEIKKQQSLAEKIGKFLYNTAFDPSSPLDPSMGMSELATAPVGIVLNQKNAGLIKNALQKFLKVVPDATEQELGMQFLREKNPTFTGLANNALEVPPKFQFLSKLLGYHDSKLNKAVVIKYPETSAADSVETLAHELTHAYQNKKDPIGLNTSYIPAKIDSKRYLDQFWERNARQGGETGKRALENFKDMVSGPTKQLDLQTHIDKSLFNEVMVPAISTLAANPKTSKLGKENLARALEEAAKTVKGSESLFPYKIEDLIHSISGYGKLDRKDVYNSLAEKGYEGFTNARYLSGVPKDIRKLSDIVKK